jgi:hypothetical protein
MCESSAVLAVDRGVLWKAYDIEFGIDADLPFRTTSSYCGRPESYGARRSGRQTERKRDPMDRILGQILTGSG